LFVDASFEKDFLVFSHLTEMAHAFFDPENPSPLPLRCFGRSDLQPPGILKDEVCECWIGPLGEQVYWIRPKDDRMYWYSGGNPITAKKVKTRAYFLWSERSQKNPYITWLSFQDCFSERKVRKVMCTLVGGADPKDIGFSEPDELDEQRVQYFQRECNNSQQRKNQISMYLKYDIRFMSKLAIGLSHVLFGEKVSRSDYAQELHKALWFREGDSDPQIQGTGALSEKDDFFKKHCGVSNGVTITIFPTRAGVAINLNLNRHMNWVINCAKLADIDSAAVEKLADGKCIVLFKTLKKGIQLSLPELIAHNQGSLKHSELERVELLAGKHVDYFKNL